MEKIKEIHDKGYLISSFKMNGLVTLRISDVNTYINGFVDQVTEETLEECVNVMHNKLEL